METHILFFILAGLLVAILVGASVWSARREKSRIFSNTFSTRPPSAPISNELNSAATPNMPPQGFNPQPIANGNPADFVEAQQQEIENSVKNIQIRLPDQPAEQYPEPQMNYGQPAVAPVANAAPPFGQPQPTISLEPPQAPVAEPAPQAVEQAVPQMVTLYVVAPEGQQFRGDVVQHNLEAVGFQFGEYNIFHRHLDNPTSPVLFSVANMMQPGVFDINNMDQFATVGLVFFMHLPSAGNDLVNVRLMIKTVESFAQSVGGFVLNDQQQLFDDMSRQAYLLRVSQA